MAFRHTPYHMLLEALGQGGCPVCTIVQEEVLHYLEMLIHEHVNDLDFRAELRQAGGFCNTHAWWLYSRVQGAALGATIMYRDVLNTARDRLAQVAASGGTVLQVPRRRGRGLLASGSHPHGNPHPGCPACTVRARIEGAFVSTLINNAQDRPFLERYGQSDGVCLIHLDKALARARGAGPLRQLLEQHEKIMNRLIAELDEFQRKADYRFHAEPIGQEGDAWQRAIELVDGKEGIR